MRHTDPERQRINPAGTPQIVVRNSGVIVLHPSGEKAMVFIDPIHGLVAEHETCASENRRMSPVIGQPKGKGFETKLTCAGCGDWISLIWDGGGMNLHDVAHTAEYIRNAMK